MAGRDDPKPGGRSERSEAAWARFALNPFFVLELAPECSRAEIERQGQKLLGMLELELRAAAFYASPLGPQQRTPERVRAAMAELRDPNRRLLHELWAKVQPTPASANSASEATSDTQPEPESPARADLSPFSALAALGFGRRRRE